MIPTPLWIASFIYLAIVSSFVCTAVKEPSDRQLFIKMGGFLGMIVFGTAAFAVVILAVETFL